MKKGLIVFLALAIGWFGMDMYLNRWKTFTPQEGGFGIEFPGDPSKDVQSESVGTIKMDITTYEKVIGDEMYSLSHIDYPQDIDLTSDPETAINGGIQGAVSSGNATLVDSKLTKFGDYHAGDFEIKDYNHKNRKFKLRGRVILTGNKVYLIMSGGESKIPDKYQKFLDSFQLK